MLTFSRMILCYVWLLEIQSRNYHTNHKNHLLFASHKLTGPNYTLNSEPGVLQHLSAARRLSQRFSDVLRKCVLCKTTSTLVGCITPECETVLREPECGISIPWASFLRVTETDRLSQKCPRKALCPAQNKERTSMFGSVSVWAQIQTETERERQRECVCVYVWWGERLYVIVSAGVKRDIVDFCLSVYLHVLTGLGWKP